MPTISESQPFTIVMTYEVDEGRQQEMIDGVADLVRQHVRSDPAFISASFHANEDRRQVMNYAQWTSRDEWEHSVTQQNKALTAKIVDVITRCGGRRTSLEFLSVARTVAA
jgi:hypothetical protein